MKIAVEAGSVAITGEYSQLVERKDPDGNIVGRQERKQSVSKRFSLPADADDENARIENRKDKITITVPKKQIS